MELIDATDAAALVTAITGAITANMAGILVVLGAVVGIGFARKFLNRSTKGKV